MKKRLIFIIVILNLSYLYTLTSCNKLHDEIYGEQSITIINNLNSSVNVTIYSINGSDSKSLGSVSAGSEKIFNLNWRNDCHYDFYATSGTYDFSNNYVDVCGGATWTIP